MSNAYNIDPVSHMNHMYNAMYNFSQVWQEHDAKSICNNMDVHSSVSMLIIMCHLNGQGSAYSQN